MSDPTIQTLDIRDYRSNDPAKKAAFVENLGRAFREIGFLVIKGHDVNETLQKRAYEKIDTFFKLPVEEKRKYEVPGIGGARGYTVFGKEKAKTANVSDLKEFFHVGVKLPEGHPLSATKDYPANVEVPAVDGFDSTLRELFDTLLATAQDLLEAIAINLGQEKSYFHEKVQFGNSILRPIHYPPLTGKEPPGALRSSAHEDINLITLLIGASYPGLQVVAKSGNWLPITTQPTEIVINVGDMLQRLSNYKFVSTTHRVVNPPSSATGDGSRRYSIPFFVHPVSDMSLQALPTCVSPTNPPRDPSTTAGEYLQERLREIGLA
jgi:isopenicillin N synthase-like dioxygenase